ncbi:MAG: bifunctional diaminohydroxyphosphoribosylaminopyrimidine deaminase/5-amino-6-(5-phosphoribosylamino)uracil reductase RibD [Woeseiaceae bacterium]|nr:bifunctional diaminohydroxyphosphoribosylaminopyrimidine deaminase/5-amino-6-(5-phosphoribosylamino)uracil reductase RibD [Woeseiaceae bacterium]
MSSFTSQDYVYMASALRLAERGQYTAHPNPMVGCVLVKDDEIVGEGWHEKTGSAHAEVNALQRAGEKARGSTAYVTLEPCSHHGKTPPCCEALIKAGVSKVIASIYDPFQSSAGDGLKCLVEAGIEVQCGLMKSAAEELNRGFLMRVGRQRPFVQLKLATSIDGAISMASGESQWITSSAARADVQRLRARSGAIMTGIGTVLVDDPSLTVRAANFETCGTQPIRVVLDSYLRTPASAAMLGLEGVTLLCCTDNRNSKSLLSSNVEVASFSSFNGRVDVNEVLMELAVRGINNVLVEAGLSLSGHLLERNLVDELVIYQAPHIMGSETMKLVSTPSWTKLADRKDLMITDTRRFGPDTRITATLKLG